MNIPIFIQLFAFAGLFVFFYLVFLSIKVLRKYLRTR
ncbi:hypothetical protein J2S05_000599 [Alkalicoccobacillus murimartini]|uniref:Uncharacterized protein n=1 Tax=Alkalicoccobacillus murimartini TaxID=171685 RepID=A0ABT9YD91_9BACI|nr:hypothetical protein [Alkalicoccobacillus murimartini]